MTATPHNRFQFASLRGYAPPREGAHRGVLDDRTRELITVTVLACLQTLPQLKAHTAAALNVGVQPI
ncbi:MAG: putative decarboxylase [Propionibacteriaceae bacterium]|nr:putative decarboxylase [Propionibacteriaceae bacterium]